MSSHLAFADNRGVAHMRHTCMNCIELGKKSKGRKYCFAYNLWKIRVTPELKGRHCS